MLKLCTALRSLATYKGRVSSHLAGRIHRLHHYCYYIIQYYNYDLLLLLCVCLFLFFFVLIYYI